jgi:hypothetical protein
MANGLSPAALVVGANAIRSALGGAQLHTADPGTGGAANKSSAAMVVPSWTVVNSSGGWDLATPLAFVGGTPNGPVTWVSLWSNISGLGVWYGNFQLSGDLTFDSTGATSVTSIPQTGSSA